MRSTKSTNGNGIHTEATNQYDASNVLLAANMPVVLFEYEGKITFFNAAAENLWGVKAQSVIGKQIQSLFEDDIVQAATRGTSIDTNAKLGKSETVPVHITVSEMGTNGSTRYMLFVQDYSAIRQMETTARENIERMRATEEELRQTMEEMTATQEEMERVHNRNIQIFEQAVDSIITIDANRIVTYMNKSAEQLFGFTREEVIGNNVKIIVPLEHRANHDGYVESNIKTGVNKVVGKGRDLEMARKDGSKFWGNLTLSKVQVGGELQYTAFIKDITEERAEKVRNIQILEQAVDSVITIDADRIITFFNKSAEKMFGYTREEVLGRNVKEIVPIEHRQNHDDYVRANMATNVNKVVGVGRDLPMVRKDGSKFWGNLSLSKVEVDGRLQYTAFIKDITEERAVKERSIQILEQAVDSVVTIDANKIITFYNKAAERMFGYTREEVMGQNIKMIVPMEHRGNHDSYVEANMNTGVNKVVGKGRDLEMVRKDGAKFWGNLSLSRVNVDGELQYTAFIKDITSTKHNELGFREVIKSINQIAAGNFDFTLELSELRVDDYVKQVTVDLQNLRDNVKNILSEVNNVVQRAGSDGDLDARLNIQTQGAWKDLTDSINLLLQSIAEPMLEFNSIISEMAKGDLTKKFEMKSKGDILVMATALNTAIENMNELLTNIGLNADVVATASMNMLKKSESMKNNTTEVASAISQMAKGAQDQALKTDESSKLVEQVLRSANEMERKSNIINKAAEKGQKSTDDGLKTIKHLVRNMTGIKESASQTSKSIGVLGQRAEEIGRTLNVITDIASQTNLLALNAAIEAARAGDAGRGFAVVAEEIRKLAEDSRKSAIDIEKIISDVQKDTQAASKAIEMMETSVKEGNTATGDAENIFQEIAKSSEETFSFSKEIQEATILQKTSIDSVVKNIEQIVVVAEETAAGSQQVASSSQQLNGSMSDIAESSNKLSEIAATLQNGVNRFKLRKQNR